MRSKVELFEQIRRDHDREGASKRELARRYGERRRTVRQALESATPPPRRDPERLAPALGAHHERIDSWLRDDLDAPPKQRHTARRIWLRLISEEGAEVSERQVCRYVQARRRALGQIEAHVPQAHPPGYEAECDWGEAKVVIAGVPTTVQLFVIRLSHSGASWVEPFPRQDQLPFLEARVRAFKFWGGVPERVRYDNLKVAVTKILRGRRREESERFVAMRSHYLCGSFFCEPGIKGAHEKGGVEGEVGRFRRNNLVPVPEVSCWAELEAMIAAACEAGLERRIIGRSRTIGEMLADERAKLRPLPVEPFDCAERSEIRVDSKGLACVRTSRYSVPIAFAGRKVCARIGAREIELLSEGRVLATHPRAVARHQVCARLDHYLELLREKPGALAGSLALAQQRERGEWPDPFDELWKAIEERTSPSEAARQMVDVLLLVRELGAEKVIEATAGALTAGSFC